MASTSKLPTKRKTKFNEEYVAEFPSIKRGRNDFEAFCKLCNSYFGIGHGGKSDIRDHVSSAKHKNNVSSASSSKPLTTYFIKSGDKTDARIVAAAEATFAYHSVRHHHSYNSSTCTSKLISEVFNDSKVAKKFSSAKTKTEAIVNNVIAPFIIADLKDALIKCEFVGISTDASNHKYHKIFPTVVQFFDKNLGIQTKLLELKEFENETSDTISEFIVDVLRENNLVKKINSFGGDNTNTNFGGVARKGENNIFTKIKLKLNKPGIVGVGCPAHILHNAVQSGADCLSVDVQCLIVKVYNYFSIYTVRVASLKEYCEFVSVTYQDVLNHVKTRWLSLFPAIERFLHMFEALKSYFLSLDKCPVYLKSFFKNDLGEAYLWFMQAQMSLFQKAITSVEKEHMSVNEVRMKLKNIVDILRERQKESFISMKVKNLISAIDLPPNEIKSFQAECMSFYQESVEYLVKWIKPLSALEPFDWLLLENPITWSHVEETLKWLNENNYEGIIIESKLFDQVLKLKSFVNDIPKDDNWKGLLAHKKWVEFFKTCISEEQYCELLKLAQFYFSIPGHNANVERIFSLMNAQWTEERNRLKLTSVKSILDIQYNMKDTSCSEFHRSIQLKPNFLDAVHSSEKYEWNVKAEKQKE